MRPRKRYGTRYLGMSPHGEIAIIPMHRITTKTPSAVNALQTHCEIVDGEPKRFIPRAFSQQARGGWPSFTSDQNQLRGTVTGGGGPLPIPFFGFNVPT